MFPIVLINKARKYSLPPQWIYVPPWSFITTYVTLLIKNTLLRNRNIIRSVSFIIWTWKMEQKTILNKLLNTYTNFLNDLLAKLPGVLWCVRTATLWTLCSRLALLCLYNVTSLLVPENSLLERFHTYFVELDVHWPQSKETAILQVIHERIKTDSERSIFLFKIWEPFS